MDCNLFGELFVVTGADWLHALRVDDYVGHLIENGATGSHCAYNDAGDHTLVLGQPAKCALHWYHLTDAA